MNTSDNQTTVLNVSLPSHEITTLERKDFSAQKIEPTLKSEEKTLLSTSDSRGNTTTQPNLTGGTIRITNAHPSPLSTSNYPEERIAKAAALFQNPKLSHYSLESKKNFLVKKYNYTDEEVNEAISMTRKNQATSNKIIPPAPSIGVQPYHYRNFAPIQQPTGYISSLWVIALIFMTIGSTLTYFYRKWISPWLFPKNKKFDLNKLEDLSNIIERQGIIIEDSLMLIRSFLEKQFSNWTDRVIYENNLKNIRQEKLTNAERDIKSIRSILSIHSNRLEINNSSEKLLENVEKELKNLKSIVNVLTGNKDEVKSLPNWLKHNNTPTNDANLAIKNSDSNENDDNSDSDPLKNSNTNQETNTVSSVQIISSEDQGHPELPSWLNSNGSIPEWQVKPFLESEKDSEEQNIG